MAVAIANGVIGYMSYDIIKKVFGKLGAYVKQRKKSSEDEK